ncbi:MAG: hypothetical protein KJ977_05265 [Candidatus Omnitrophica bacterium]|nr:hypothetical protein [Candidatus Omnitrophota bacterium]MBU2266432.1 hypothetical protein [Candidatus Omnitrophota bacterium]
MAYTVKNVLDDVIHRIQDEEGKVKRGWLTHLVNVALVEFAERTHWWVGQKKVDIDTRFNAFILPEDFLELKNIRYSADGNEYSPLFPMDYDQAKYYSKQTYHSLAEGQAYWTAATMPEADGWVAVAGIYDKEPIIGTLSASAEQLPISLQSDNFSSKGQYTLWEKEFVMDNQLGWSVEGKFLAPSFIRGGKDTARNEIFAISGVLEEVIICVTLEMPTEGSQLLIKGLLQERDVYCAAGDIIKLQISGYKSKLFCKITINGTEYIDTFEKPLSANPHKIRFGGMFTCG